MYFEYWQEASPSRQKVNISDVCQTNFSSSSFLSYQFLWPAQQDSVKVTFSAAPRRPLPLHQSRTALLIRQAFYLSNTCHRSQATAQSLRFTLHTSVSLLLPACHANNANFAGRVRTLVLV